MERFQGALVGAALMASVGAASSPAAAADDGYENVFSSVLTAVGVLKPDEAPEIDYRERAPLVLPPKNSLEKPVTPGTARSAAWPQDPDVIKRRKAAEEARAPMPNILGNPNNVLSKDELMAGRSVGATREGEIPESALRHDRCGNEGNQRGCGVLSPDELWAEHQRYEAAGGGQPKDEIVAGEEPSRVYLTQPPKGYLKATKTVKATAEAPKTYEDASNPKAALVYKKNPDE